MCQQSVFCGVLAQAALHPSPTPPLCEETEDLSSHLLLSEWYIVLCLVEVKREVLKLLSILKSCCVPCHLNWLTDRLTLVWWIRSDLSMDPFPLSLVHQLAVVTHST